MSFLTMLKLQGLLLQLQDGLQLNHVDHDFEM
jgi:hypothetical protein